MKTLCARPRFDVVTCVGVASIFLGLSNKLADAERFARMQSRFLRRFLEEEAPQETTMSIAFYGCSPYNDQADAHLLVRGVIA